MTYDEKALSLISISPTWAYWCISRRMHAALKRLEKAGKIKWTTERFPYWRFEIL